MEIIGHYSNGAVRLAEYIDMGGRPHGLYTAFPDCPNCKGMGIVTFETTEMQFVRKGRKYIQTFVPVTHTKKCQTCLTRIGDKETIKAHIQNVIAQVEAEVHTYALGGKYKGITVDKCTGEPVSLEDYNVNNPLAQEYRRLLKAWWSYQEPEYTPVVNN